MNKADRFVLRWSKKIPTNPLMLIFFAAQLVFFTSASWLPDLAVLPVDLLAIVVGGWAFGTIAFRSHLQDLQRKGGISSPELTEHYERTREQFEQARDQLNAVDPRTLSEEARAKQQELLTMSEQIQREIDSLAPRCRPEEE